MIHSIRSGLVSLLAVALSVFTIYEVNYGFLPPLSQLAVFAMLGTVLCFLVFPTSRKHQNAPIPVAMDFVMVGITVACCTYLVWHGKELGNRAGMYTTVDFVVAIAGTLVIIEATRRSIGWALPLLALLFLLYAFFGPLLPEVLFPHRGYDIPRIASHCFLRTEGVFGVAMRVMFTYVFLFVVFGAFLEMSGATQFIIDFAKRVFGHSPGGPAKVSVLASGLMGSLSGSAVANAVTTGTFTIPMMRSAGFPRHVAGGITAAAASGAALVPPVMGAGAYMMLEIISPPVTFLEIVKAALIPAVLYYVSILLIVHFYARRVGATTERSAEGTQRSVWQYEGLVFVTALTALIGFLLMGYTPFRAVTYALEVILLLSIFNPRLNVGRWARVAGFVLLMAATASGVALATERGAERWTDWTAWADAGIVGMLVVLMAALAHPSWRSLVHEAFQKAAKGGIPLVAASGCVGIIIGVVGLTGAGTAFPNAIVPLAKESLLLALMAIMGCSLILGMGLPSAVCYLLMATLIGPVLSRLGVPPLAAHLFIFYFGMMSMVTPPVALAGYASASLAEASIMATSFAAFRFALVGFTLPYMFVYRPALLLLAADGQALSITAVIHALIVALAGIVALAAGLAGYWRHPLNWLTRAVLFLAAALLLVPIHQIGGHSVGIGMEIAGAVLLGLVALRQFIPQRPQTLSAA